MFAESRSQRADSAEFSSAEMRYKMELPLNYCQTNHYGILHKIGSKPEEITNVRPIIYSLSKRRFHYSPHVIGYGRKRTFVGCRDGHLSGAGMDICRV